MFENIMRSAQAGKTIEISPDPRPGIGTPTSPDMLRWLDDDAEIIDLGQPKRDEVIQPTTWH